MDTDTKPREYKGRAPYPPEKRRRSILAMSLTEREMQRLQDAAEPLGLPASTYARIAVLLALQNPDEFKIIEH